MPVYRLSQSGIVPLPETEFAACGLKERSDLQRLLRANVGAVAPGVLVIAEEFCEWDDSKRRIDLLGVDAAGNLVVIELKRDDDSHMELQALRYAAMVARMKFSKAVEVFQEYLSKSKPGSDANTLLLEHLGWDEPREEDFAPDVNIVLVSRVFSKELTTTALWLSDYGIQVRCVRAVPYMLDGQIILDVQQVVPLPEAEQYTIQIKEKVQATRAEKAERHQLRRAFWQELLARCSKLTPRFAQLTPGDDCWIGAGTGYSGLRLVYLAWQNESAVELYIDRGADSEKQNKAILKRLEAHKAAIESTFGGPLEWDYIAGKRAARLRSPSLEGGVKSPRDAWPEIQDRLISAMARMEKGVQPFLEKAVL